MNNYIFIVGESFEGYVKIDPFEEFKKRLKLNFWYLYKRTRYAQGIAVNDSVLFYVSGKNNRKIYGSAKIKLKEKITKKQFNSYTYNDPIYLVKFRDVLIFDDPKLVIDKIQKCDFYKNSLKKNLNKWGVYFMGGVRKITKKDYLLLSS